jgi:hypothetical protein
MHSKYAGQGLVCASVSLDKPDDREKALKFLKQVKAEFSNFLLDEPEEAWQKKWDVGGPPVILVYGKDGKLAKKFEGASYEADVEPLVKKLLAEK